MSTGAVVRDDYEYVSAEGTHLYVFRWNWLGRGFGRIFGLNDTSQTNVSMKHGKRPEIL